MANSRWFCWVITVACVLLGAATLFPPRARSQTRQDDFSDPLRLSASTGFTSNLRIVGDRYGRPHVFWIENPSPEREASNEEAIFYMYWDGAQWSEPRDILVAPSGGRLSGFSVTLDDANRFHLVLIDFKDSSLYYTAADLSAADRPQSWAAPRLLVSERVFGSQIECAADRLYIVYMLYEEPFEAFAMRSDNSGASWSRPIQVSNVRNMNEAVSATSLAIGPDGALHVAWASSALPDGYPPQRVMYARSTDGGETWSEAFEIQVGRYGLPLIAAASEDQLYLTYNGAAGTNGRYFHWSADGGRSWSERITIDPGVGGLTGGTMALDSAGTLHYASASHMNGLNGIAYSQWNGRQWTPLIDLAKTPPDTDEKVRQGYEPQMIVTEGNHIRLVYLGANHADLFYVTARSAAPAIIPPPLTAPTRAPTSQPTRIESASSDLTPTPLSTKAAVSPPAGAGGQRDTTMPVVWGVLPVILIVGLVSILHYMRLRR